MPISGVIYETREIDHEDDRRSLFTAFNGGFEARQVKFAQMHKDAVLGGHFHKYKELFYMLLGNAEFDLLDIKTQEDQHYKLNTMDRLIIPPLVAHKGLVKKGSILVGCTEQPYVSPEHNDFRYEF